MEYVIFVVVLVICTSDADDIKVQGGMRADITNFPFIGCLLTQDQDKTCTANLVKWDAAITAGLCIVSSATPVELAPVGQYELVMGVSDFLDKTDPGYQTRKIVKFHIHEKAEYGRPEPITSQYDIGAMILNAPMKRSLTVDLVHLIPESTPPALAIDDIIQKKEECDLPGWGEQFVTWNRYGRPFTPSFYLKTARFSLLSKKACCHIFFPNRYHVCLGTLGPSSGYHCFTSRGNDSVAVGDAGSPIVCSYEGNTYVVGIYTSGLISTQITPTGQTQTYNPAFRITETEMRRYIQQIIDMPNVMNTGVKSTKVVSLVLTALSQLLNKGTC